MAVESIVLYDTLADPSVENITEWFTTGKFFYIDSPGLLSEFELDCFLNIRVEEAKDKIISLKDGDTLNISDTERVFLIPNQFNNATFQKRLILLVQEAVNLKVTLIDFVDQCMLTEDDESGLLDEILDSIKKILDIAKTITELIQLVGTIYNIVALIANLLGVPLPPLPIPPGLPGIPDLPAIPLTLGFIV